MSANRFAKPWAKLVEECIADMLAPPLVKIEGASVVITCAPVCCGTYDFEVSRCDTPLKLLGWLLHLGEKTWFTNDHQAGLICVVAKHYGWQVPR
jgi:hypothetical protein